MALAFEIVLVPGHTFQHCCTIPVESDSWSRSLLSASHFGRQMRVNFLQSHRSTKLRPNIGRATDLVGFSGKNSPSVDTDGLDFVSTQLVSRCLGKSAPSYGMMTYFAPVPRSNLNDVLVRFMAKLQLLGIFTAIALGMTGGIAAASTSTPAHSTGRSLELERRSVEWYQATGFKEIDEDLGVREDIEALQPNRAQKNGITADVEDGDDEEARREYEALRTKPYQITVPLKIVALRGSVPPVWLKDFMQSQGKRVKLMAEFQGSLQSIFSELTSALENKHVTPRSAMAADLVTIGDSWLGKAVSGGLISPLENVEQFDWYQRMGTRWQTFIRRNDAGLVDPDGKVWAVPYRWGKLVIAYNHEKLRKHGIPAIKDWSDLWRPDLTGKISMVASPREVVGAVLKVLGASYNVKDFDTDVPGGRQAMKEKFFALQKQVRIFDNVQYLKTLGAGEVWVAVGWSGDVVPFSKRTSNITVITPKSGTSLWADFWAIPATGKTRSTRVGGRIRGPSPLILQWIDFCLQPARGNSFQHDVMVGASPLTLSKRAAYHETKVGSQENAGLNFTGGLDTGSSSMERDRNMEDLEDRDSNLERDLIECVLPLDVVARSEFLEPLSEKALSDFMWLLQENVVAPSFPLAFLDSVKSFYNALSNQ